MTTTTETLTAALREVADHEFKALVTIETAERLAVKAHYAIDAGDLDEAKRLIEALTAETSIRTVTAVKDQNVSDAISRKATERVRKVMAPSDAAPSDSDDANAVEHADRIRAQEPQYGLIGRPDRPGGV